MCIDLSQLNDVVSHVLQAEAFLVVGYRPAGVVHVAIVQSDYCTVLNEYRSKVVPIYSANSAHALNEEEWGSGSAL